MSRSYDFVSWIVKHGVAKSDEQIVIHQGFKAGRPSELFVRATRNGEKVTNCSNWRIRGGTAARDCRFVIIVGG
jgi:predicted PhzF superfamily epimerase YddE/YHI9